MPLLRALLSLLETLEFLLSPFVWLAAFTLMCLWQVGLNQGIPHTCLTLTCLCFIGILFLYDEGKL